jgi:hypothetical protein
MIKPRSMIKISGNSLSILLYLYIFTIPYSKPSFLVLFLVLIISFAFAWRKNITLTLSKSAYDYILSVFLALILVWNLCYINSYNKDQDWEDRLHEIIYPLTGENVGIVPSYAKGYILDSTCDSRGEKGFGYFETDFKTLKVKDGDSLKASVYCFVSEDFNGDSVNLLVNGAVYGNRISNFKLFDSYDKKMNFPGNLIGNGDFKNGTTNWIASADSTTLNIIETPYGQGLRVSRTNGDGGDWSLRYIGRPIIYYAGHKYQIKFLFKIEKGNEIPFSIGWWVDDGSGFINHDLHIDIRKLKNGWNEATCSYLFKKTHYNLFTFLNSLQDYSVVDIANVEIKDLDRIDSLPLFVDQLSHKGTWQKLTVKAPCIEGKASVSFRIIKNNVMDLKSLKGYVVFALPKWSR